MSLLSPTALCFDYCLNVNSPLSITLSNLANQYNVCIRVRARMVY